MGRDLFWRKIADIKKMSQVRLLKTFIIFCAFFVVNFTCLADFDVAVGLDWNESKLSMSFERQHPPDANLSPLTRFRTEQELQQEFIGLAYSNLLAIPVTSCCTIENTLNKDRQLSSELNNCISHGLKEYSYFDVTHHLIRIEYSFPFFGENGLLNAFLRHKVNTPLPAKPGFYATRPYSGIVIFARGEYPMFGKEGKARLTPLFFPDFYDEELNLFFTKSNCDPAFIKRWGMVAYTSGFDETAYKERIGETPLRLSLRGIFGTIPADLIIPSSARDKLLALEENRRLLREGRILIICDLP